MSTPESAAGPVPRTGAPPSERQRISCPGCGRHDWVAWPESQATYEWKCFNCEKQFTLRRGGKH